ncbi:MAG: dihydroxyacetone kinase subunit L, partial [Candidatus Eremiobacteraeota bacterium]|nr:dihydroxyacetone kinase subunit L [Candidatus Eremiobacteraeota bacterium]
AMLCELDAVGGDGDHGMSLTLGARGALVAVAPLDGSDVGLFLTTIGKSLISGIGAAMGPLYGTALVQAGKYAAGKGTLAPADIAAMLAAARDGMIARGKAKVGDKTMLDALAPAADAAEAAATGGQTTVEVLRAASLAADEGAKATSAMIATKGRAARLGERTRGHQDAGATSTAVVLRAILDASVREHAPA